MIEIKKLRQLEYEARNQVLKVFVDAYYEELADLCKNRYKWQKALAESFDGDVFYIALEHGRPVGLAACVSKNQVAAKLDKKKFLSSLGLIKGMIGYTILKKELETLHDFGEKTGYITSVGTSPQYQGRGIASQLFEHIAHHSGYEYFVLEVVDKNEKAYRLYEKMGFTAFSRIPAKFFEKKYFKERIYMKLG